MGTHLREGEECECEWERLDEGMSWQDNQMFITVHPITSWEQCELVCCYRQLGCAAYTHTKPDLCKIWVNLQGAFRPPAMLVLHATTMPRS